MGLGAGADVPHHGDGGLARRLECLGRKGQVELAAEPGKQPFRRHSEALPITGGLLRTVVAPARMLGAFMRPIGRAGDPQGERRRPRGAEPLPACGAQPLPPRARHGFLHRLSSTLCVDTVYYTTIRYVAITKLLSRGTHAGIQEKSLVVAPRPADHWTEMRLNYLRLRWEQGASAERISHELGGITRHSVLGKVRRLGDYS